MLFVSLFSRFLLLSIYIQKTIQKVSDHFVEKIRHESTTLNNSIANVNERYLDVKSQDPVQKSVKLNISSFVSSRLVSSPRLFKYNVSVNSNWVTSPGQNFFERANPGHPDKVFCLIPCSREKMIVEFLGAGQNFCILEETTP